MLILLPPSEGKAAPARRGKPVDLDTLSSPELTAARRKVLDALIETSGTDAAADVLGLSPGQAGELDRNLRLTRNPARPAGTIYTGVLYDALDLAGLEPAAKRRGNRSIRIQSALWGPITPADRIPPYRMSIQTDLPGIGPLTSFWRNELADHLTDTAGELIIDCRSASYAAAWRPADRSRVLTVDAVTEQDGRRRTVSHFAKYTRGLVARLLLQATPAPRTAQQAAAVIAGHVRSELTGPDRSGWHLQVITDAQGRFDG